MAHIKIFVVFLALALAIQSIGALPSRFGRSPSRFGRSDKTFPPAPIIEQAKSSAPNDLLEQFIAEESGNALQDLLERIEYLAKQNQQYKPGTYSNFKG